MSTPISRYLPTQVIFGAVFILSACFLFLSTEEGAPFAVESSSASPTRIVPSISSPAGARTPGARPTPKPTRPPVPPGDTDSNYIITVMLPLITSILSALGLASTTLMAWHKERRDAGAAAVELERQKIELEKAKLELEQQKKELAKQS